MKNQSQQIKKLQEYIKKMRMEMLKMQNELDSVTQSVIQGGHRGKQSKKQGPCHHCALKNAEIADLK